MEDDKSGESKTKISELKHRLNQMYAQYFSDTREGRVFEAEFSLYAKASEHARREQSRQIELQHGMMKSVIMVLIASSAFIIFLFRQYALFSTFFLLGLGFLACGFMYLLLSAEIRIARAERFSLDLAHYFQQHRWDTDSKQNLHLPEMPLWEEYAARADRGSSRSRRCEHHALYTPFRIAISFIDLLALAFLVQSVISGETSIISVGLIGSLFLWVAAVPAHMLLVQSLVTHAERVREQQDTDSTEGATAEKTRWKAKSWTHILRLFFLMDIIFPKPPAVARDNVQMPGQNLKS